MVDDFRKIDVEVPKRAPYCNGIRRITDHLSVIPF
jgi:hypothetical protein